MSTIHHLPAAWSLWASEQAGLGPHGRHQAAIPGVAALLMNVLNYHDRPSMRLFILMMVDAADYSYS